jgi:signal peptidase II
MVDIQRRYKEFLTKYPLRPPDFKGHLIFWSLLVFGLGADLWTKNAVFACLADRGSISIIDGFLRLSIAVNDGAAFGILSGWSVFLMAGSFAALLIIISIFLFGGNRQKLVNISLGLFAAGVCGNLYDRVFNKGLVRDFIDVTYWPGRPPWPAFNVADSLLCIGVALLITSMVLTERLNRKRGRQHK